jgi:hypothetical protein
MKMNFNAKQSAQYERCPLRGLQRRKGAKAESRKILGRRGPPPSRFRTFVLFASLVVSVFPASASLTSVYISQSGAGAQNGTTAGNAYPVTFLTTGGNWGSGGAQIGAGTTVFLEGAFTLDGIGIPGAVGGSSGNPVIIKFDTGATISSPDQATTGYGIGLYHNNYIVIDGGGITNGAIFCTANGYGLAHANNTVGIAITACSNITVQNIAITNMYVPVQNQTPAAVGIGVWIHDDGSGNGMVGVTCSNVLFHDEYFGPLLACGKITNTLITGCQAYNCNWGVGAGDANSSSILSGLVISNCYFHNWQAWNDPTDAAHHNAAYVYTANGGVATGIFLVGNVVGPGYGGGNQTAGFFASGNVGNIWVVNNVFNNTDGTTVGNGFVTVGIYNDAAQYTVNILNNDFIGGAAYQSGLAIDIGNGNQVHSPIYNVSNNIVIYQATAVAQQYAQYQNADGIDDNLYYGNAASTEFVANNNGSGGFLNQAAWQGGGHDVHSQFANPLLGTAYIPQPGSAATGNGGDFHNLIPALNYDALGNARPSVGAWTIGAMNGITTAVNYPTITGQ